MAPILWFAITQISRHTAGPTIRRDWSPPSNTRPPTPPHGNAFSQEDPSPYSQYVSHPYSRSPLIIIIIILLDVWQLQQYRVVAASFQSGSTDSHLQATASTAATTDQICVERSAAGSRVGVQRGVESVHAAAAAFDLHCRSP